MANLRGVLKSDRSEVSRLSSHEISSRLNTWEGYVRTHLFKNGRVVVFVNEEKIYEGNVNQEEA